MKKNYVQPTLKTMGKLEDLTHGKSTGTNVDAGFTIAPGTDPSTITFTFT